MNNTSSRVGDEAVNLLNIKIFKALEIHYFVLGFPTGPERRNSHLPALWGDVGTWHLLSSYCASVMPSVPHSSRDCFGDLGSVLSVSPG